jgi:hypothetical protein
VHRTKYFINLINFKKKWLHTNVNLVKWQLTLAVLNATPL